MVLELGPREAKLADRSVLVLVQVSLSFTLLTGIGLLVKSLQALRDANPGFSAANVVVSGSIG